uniref:Uncharacterized protein n=1 Tax=Picea glauca TaxID=3330 RepID=A0A101LTL3_PICGL|nr:hypothetical protein ABT39_MTgene4049 [Picea glauca]
MLEKCIRTIKLGREFLTLFSFEGSLLIPLRTKKHLVPFRKLTFQMTMICLLLHAILSHDQISLRVRRMATRTVCVRSTS